MIKINLIERRGDEDRGEGGRREEENDMVRRGGKGRKRKEGEKVRER